MKTKNTYTSKTGIVGHPFHHAAKVGEMIETAECYRMRFHETYGNADFRVKHSVMVDDGLVQVVSDDNTNEWVWLKEDGTAEYTKHGYGSEGYALHAALNHAYAR